jgi:hypothetical protein
MYWGKNQRKGNLMRKRNFIGIILALFLVVGCMVGCATTDQPLTKEDAYKVALMSYDKALVWYTRAANTYEMHYQAAPLHVRRDWKERVDPVFLDAKDALDAWRDILKAGSLGTDEQTTWDDWVFKLALLGLDFLEGYQK